MEKTIEKLKCPVHKTTLAKISNVKGSYHITLHCRKCKKEYRFIHANLKKIDSK